MSPKAFPDSSIGRQVNRRTVSLIHLWGPGESLQDLHCSSHNPTGNTGGQVRGGHGPLGDRRDTGSWSYVTQVWASGSHTKTSHLHCSVSISMCALGRARSLSRFKRVSCWQALIGMPGISQWCHRGITRLHPTAGSPLPCPPRHHPRSRLPPGRDTG